MLHGPPCAVHQAAPRLPPRATGGQSNGRRDRTAPAAALRCLLKVYCEEGKKKKKKGFIWSFSTAFTRSQLKPSRCSRGTSLRCSQQPPLPAPTRPQPLAPRTHTGTGRLSAPLSALPAPLSAPLSALPAPLPAPLSALSAPRRSAAPADVAPRGPARTAEAAGCPPRRWGRPVLRALSARPG